MKSKEIITQEGNYKDMFLYNPTPMWIFDQETLDYVEVNDAALEHYGYTRDEFLSMNARDIRPAESVHALEEDIKNSMNRAHFAGDWVHIKKNGERIIVNVVSHPFIFKGRMCRHVMANDVTAQRKLEQELIDSKERLTESEHRYRAFFENSLDAMILTSPGGEIYEANDSACQLLGYTQNEIRSMHVYQLIDIKDPNHEKIRDRRAEYGRTVGELRFIRKDGSIIHTELSSAIFLDANGHEKASVIIRDITERIRHQQNILQLNAELEQRIEQRTAQLTAVNRDLEAFAYSVSHDLRAPLRGINGLTAILEENYASKLDEEGARLCSRIRTNSVKMGTLIDDLLTFSKTSTAEIRRTHVDMEFLVRNAVAEQGEKEPLDKVDFHITKLPVTIGDTALLKQVWVNLISNAVKFSSKVAHPCIEITGWKEGVYSVYSIKDNGAGFSMDYVDKIFVAFQRLHSEKDYAGTGAGLAIVERIIQKHGGKIEAFGEEGKGATFTFRLPAS